MIGFSLINNSAMQTSLLLETLLDIFTFMNWSFVDRSKTFSFLHKVIGIGKKFTRYFFLHLLEFIAILLEESWHIYIIFLCWSNKNMVFKAKIKPDTFTQSRNDSILFHLTNKENVDVAYGVSLNRYGLDGSFDFSGLVVTVLLPIDGNSMIIFVQFPSRLFKSKRFCFTNFSAFWRTFIFLAKKLLIAKINTLCNILHGLRAEFCKIVELRNLLQLSHMLLKFSFIQRFME